LILAGDFAQLPPVGGVALYRPTITDKALASRASAGKSLHQQKVAIGKFIWHQVCVVVILKQNMRQTLEGGPDARYRRALENMSETKCLSLPIFRNVSIITSRNSYKDRYNELGCESFAKGRGETLHTFHSVDFMANNKDETADKKRLGKRKATKVGLPESLQRLLWTQEPHTSDHIPAVLKLCKGMPV
ncbi:hypothetical protein DFP72DRAFT_766061, partial [Ephemerocybe angulata]